MSGHFGHVIPTQYQNLDKISWFDLSCNINAISILQQNLDNINWSSLSWNCNAILLLEQNQDKINWKELSRNLNVRSICLVIIALFLYYHEVYNNVYNPYLISRYVYLIVSDYNHFIYSYG